MPATFYMTGAESEELPESLCMLIAAGHEIGDHSYSHVRLLAGSQEAIAGEVEQTDGLIRAAGYGGEITFRPPYGERFVAAPHYLWSRGCTTVTSDVAPDSIEAITDDPGALVEYALGGVAPGRSSCMSCTTAGHVSAGPAGQLLRLHQCSARDRRVE